MEYVVVSDIDDDELSDKLNDWAAEGFRVLHFAQAFDGKVDFIMTVIMGKGA